MNPGYVSPRGRKSCGQTFFISYRPSKSFPTCYLNANILVFILMACPKCPISTFFVAALDKKVRDSDALSKLRITRIASCAIIELGLTEMEEYNP